jgi:light-harvesting complex 1 beta chain
MTHEPTSFHTSNRDGISANKPLDGFQGIFCVMFVVFLVVAMASMLCFQNWRTFLPGAEGARSMLDGVKSAVYTVISQLS